MGVVKIKYSTYVRPQQELSCGTPKYKDDSLASTEKPLTSKTDEQQTSVGI
jgi:hypothetical protein